MVLETRRNFRALARVCSFFGSLVSVNYDAGIAIILFRSKKLVCSFLVKKIQHFSDEGKKN